MPPKKICRRHGGHFEIVCPKCLEQPMAAYTHTLEVTVMNQRGRKGYHIRWELEDSTWVGYRQMPGVNQFAELPDLSSDNMLDIFKWMRDIVNGSIDRELIIPSAIAA